MTSDSLHLEIKKIIVESLALEDIAPEEIETAAPLFVEGLGLDSIDALELAMSLEEKYGVTVGDDPDENQKIFFSVESLAQFVTDQRG
ncbi:MAG: acyl carrier protein [Deltaproteobacteria bacterium]|nr:acyl carrier protein [Deltaproteobacteria bacterium]MBW2394842.1 acyl carrier protein [Deltaproteobacteria bacterium]